MSEEREMILRMLLKEGKISVEEADALLQALEESGGATPGPAAPAGGPGARMPDLRAELRGVFDELVRSMPQEVIGELKRTKDVLRPSLLGALQALRGLPEGQTASAAEEPMTAGEQLVLRNTWGDVQLAGRSSGSLRVTATRRAWAGTAGEAQRLAESVAVTPTRNGSDVVIDVAPVDGRRVRVDLEAEVPPGVGASLRLANGDVRVSRLSGPLAVTVTRGDVHVSDLKGSVESGVTSGDVALRSVDGDASLEIRSGDVNAADVAGVVTAHVPSGDIDIERCGGAVLDVIHGDASIDHATGDVAIDGKSGNLTLRDLRNRAVRVRTLSGDVTVGVAALPVDGTVSLETLSGDIGLDLPAESRGTIDAAVRSGEVDCALPLANRAGDRRSLRGTLNGPGARIILRTTSGDIEIRGAR